MILILLVILVTLTMYGYVRWRRKQAPLWFSIVAGLTTLFVIVLLLIDAMAS